MPRAVLALACHPEILRREAWEILLGLFSGVRDGGAAPPFLSAGPWRVRAVCAPEVGRPQLGPGKRPIQRRRRRGVRGSAASSGVPGSPKAHFLAEIGTTRDDSNPRVPAAEAGLGFSEIWAKKEQTSLTPLETSVLGARIYFLANALAGARGLRVPFLASPFARCGVSGQPRVSGGAGRTETLSSGTLDSSGWAASLGRTLALQKDNSGPRTYAPVRE